MALTRRALKAMGIEEEKIDEIITMHTETVDGLKAASARYQADAEQLPKVQKELDALKAAGDGGWQEKYENVKKELDEYKAEVSTKEAKAAKERAVRAYYEGKGITGKALDIAMRGSGEEIAALEMDGDRIKDTSALDELVQGTFAGLVSTTTTKGADTATPPANTGGGRLTREDIYKKDEHGRYVLGTAERQRAIAENLDAFTGP